MVTFEQNALFVPQAGVHVLPGVENLIQQLPQEERLVAQDRAFGYAGRAYARHSDGRLVSPYDVLLKQAVIARGAGFEGADEQPSLLRFDAVEARDQLVGDMRVANSADSFESRPVWLQQAFAVDSGIDFVEQMVQCRQALDADPEIVNRRDLGFVDDDAEVPVDAGNQFPAVFFEAIHRRLFAPGG